LYYTQDDRNHQHQRCRTAHASEQEDYASIHGHDERISLENVRLGTQVLFELVRRPAT
jgi:hypothetical protein